jgi:hypothetical protein
MAYPGSAAFKCHPVVHASRRSPAAGSAARPRAAPARVDFDENALIGVIRHTPHCPRSAGPIRKVHVSARLHISVHEIGAMHKTRGYPRPGPTDFRQGIARNKNRLPGHFRHEYPESAPPIPAAHICLI